MAKAATAAAPARAFATFIDAWNTKDYDKLTTALAENFSRVAPDFDASSRDEMIAGMRNVHAAYPDFHIVTGESAYAGNLSFNQWTVTGTSTAADGTPARLSVSGVSMMRYAAGLITEEWPYFDTGAITSQLGVSAMPHVR